MADTKTDSSSTPLSDDPANPTKGLSAKPNTASHPAGAEPALDTLFHRTSRDCYRHGMAGREHCVLVSGLAVQQNRESLERASPSVGPGTPCVASWPGC